MGALEYGLGQDDCFIVESDPDLAALYQERMEQAGYSVRLFTSTSTVSLVLSESTSWPAAILLSLSLDQEPATRLLEQISHDPRRNNLSVVVLGATNECPNEMAQHDFVHFIPKSRTTPGKLVARLRQPLTAALS